MRYVGRSTYYAWRKEDKEFAKLADEAVKSGTLFINDMAESKLIQNIQSGNNTAIIFWLKNHHRDYGDRVRHEHEFIEEELTSEQKIAIAKALFNSGHLTSFGRNNMIRKAGGTAPIRDPEEDAQMEETLRQAEELRIKERWNTPEAIPQKNPEKMVNIAEILRKQRVEKETKIVEPPPRRPLKNGANINDILRNRKRPDAL